MGYTPLEGLVMGTRCGDIDAGLVLALMRNENLSLDETDRMLNKRSGLLGVSGIDNDMRTLLEHSSNADAALAVEIFCRKLAEKIASYFILLDKPAIVFTAGIGENSAEIRERTIVKLKNLGYAIDSAANQSVPQDGKISSKDSLPVFRIRTNEEKLIAQKVFHLLEK